MVYLHMISVTLFARKYKLPIQVVIQSKDIELKADTMKESYVGDGIQVNSDIFDGMSNTDAIRKIAEYLESKGLGARAVTYRLRDWLISRQRYWGAPIPLFIVRNAARYLCPNLSSLWCCQKSRI